MFKRMALNGVSDEVGKMKNATKRRSEESKSNNQSWNH